MQIKNKFGETLVGVETLPSKGENKYPAVVEVHGFAYFKEEDGIFVEVAKRLSEIEIGSYRFDFSGCGESEGNYAATTVTKLKDDLATILEYVKQRPTTDSERVGILAQSFGTTTTIALAPEIKSLVLMGSFLNGKKVLANLFGKGYNPDGLSIEIHSDRPPTEINPAFWQDFENHNLTLSLQKINCPLLLIHGSEDDHVPPSEMETIYQFANQPKEKLIIKGGDHGMTPKRDEMYKAVVDWFKKTL